MKKSGEKWPMFCCPSWRESKIVRSFQWGTFFESKNLFSQLAQFDENCFSTENNNETAPRVYFVQVFTFPG